MNGFESAAVPSDADLDRLVDGELSAAERRVLVRRLDASSDGWKRCALAFMEAQAWREALHEARPVVVTTASVPTKSWRTSAQWLTVAAVVLLAFGGGRLSQQGDARPMQLVQHPAPGDVHFAATETGVRTLGQVVWPSQGKIAVRGVPSMQITIYEGAGIDDRWVAALPAVVPDLVAKQLERQGCKVREERRLVPLSLADGRRLALRVDQVHFTLTGRPSVL
jgi:hypothetical protein